MPQPPKRKRQKNQPQPHTIIDQEQRHKMRQFLLNAKILCPYFWTANQTGELTQAIAYLRHHGMRSVPLATLKAQSGLTIDQLKCVKQLEIKFPLFWKGLQTGQLEAAFQLRAKCMRTRDPPPLLPPLSFRSQPHYVWRNPNPRQNLYSLSN